MVGGVGRSRADWEEKEEEEEEEEEEPAFDFSPPPSLSDSDEEYDEMVEAFPLPFLSFLTRRVGSTTEGTLVAPGKAECDLDFINPGADHDPPPSPPSPVGEAEPEAQADRVVAGTLAREGTLFLSRGGVRPLVSFARLAFLPALVSPSSSPSAPSKGRRPSSMNLMKSANFTACLPPESSIVRTSQREKTSNKGLESGRDKAAQIEAIKIHVLGEEVWM